MCCVGACVLCRVAATIISAMEGPCFGDAHWCSRVVVARVVQFAVPLGEMLARVVGGGARDMLGVCSWRLASVVRHATCGALGKTMVAVGCHAIARYRLGIVLVVVVGRIGKCFRRRVWAQCGARASAAGQPNGGAIPT